MSFDYRLHVFRSPQFQSVVEEAITFFNTTPAHELPPPGSFVGTGVYALFYAGGFDSYWGITSLNQKSQTQPIYFDNVTFAQIVNLWHKCQYEKQ